MDVVTYPSVWSFLVGGLTFGVMTSALFHCLFFITSTRRVEEELK